MNTWGWRKRKAEVLLRLKELDIKGLKESKDYKNLLGRYEYYKKKARG
jgi:hypothetical protein